MKKIKQERGITLIALVITIIVLLILAGVAISMLSGENGILTRASEAKENTEKAQKEEDVSLIDMEVQIDFSTATKTIPYKFKNGYLTNISVTGVESETVEAVESKLPDGYTVCDANGNSISNKEATKAGTGMIIKKDDKPIGRIIVFGDINGDGILDIDDYVDLSKISNNNLDKYQDYQIVSADINHNGAIGAKDAEIISGMLNGDPEKTIIQDSYTHHVNELKKCGVEYQQSIVDNELTEEFKTNYSIKYDKRSKKWKVTVTSGTKAIDMLKKLGDKYSNSYVTVEDEDEDSYTISITNTAETEYVLKNGDKLMILGANTEIDCYITIE